MAEVLKPPELKPCPFCSGTHLRVKRGVAPSFANESLEIEKWWVTCHDCGTDGPYVNSAKLAVDTWNLREDYDALKAQRDELLAATEELQRGAQRDIQNNVMASNWPGWVLKVTTDAIAKIGGAS